MVQDFLHQFGMLGHAYRNIMEHIIGIIIMIGYRLVGSLGHHLGKRKTIFKSALVADMLVPRRVSLF